MQNMINSIDGFDHEIKNDLILHLKGHMTKMATMSVWNKIIKNKQSTDVYEYLGT